MITFKLEGRVGDEIQQSLQEWRDALNTDEVTIDLSDVSSMSSQAIGVLAALNRVAKNSHSTIYVIAPRSPNVWEALERTHLTKILRLVEPIAE